jgi:hypothetical protein
MNTRRNGLFATLICALLMPAVCGAEDLLVSDTAPPLPRTEHAPPHRDGYVWAPGYWDKSGHSFRWVSGTWVNERRGMHWVADRWEQSGTEWHLVRGHFEP